MFVLTFYSFYRYIVQHIEVFRDYTWTNGQVQIYYLILILIVIHTASRMANEVIRVIFDFEK